MKNLKIVCNIIQEWLIKQLDISGQKGFVVGVSGGIDSAVVSALCARTGKPTICLTMPITGEYDILKDNAEKQFEYLRKYKNVSKIFYPLKSAFNEIKFSPIVKNFNKLALANAQSRLRMVALYLFSNTFNYLVVGTGNRVEDFGVGFFTKYGDGGVDISPIGDLNKSEVRAVAKFLKIPMAIQKATPTDGLWEDGRTDEQQIGNTYKELEWAMKWCDNFFGYGNEYESFYKEYIFYENVREIRSLTKKQKCILKNYLKRHDQNKHKFCMPPICKIK